MTSGASRPSRARRGGRPRPRLGTPGPRANDLARRAGRARCATSTSESAQAAGVLNPISNSLKISVENVWKRRISNVPNSASRIRADDEASAEQRRPNLLEHGAEERERRACCRASRATSSRSGSALRSAAATGQVDQRVAAGRHHEHRAPEAVDARRERVPAEPEHEVGDGERQDEQDRPRAAGTAGRSARCTRRPRRRSRPRRA